MTTHAAAPRPGSGEMFDQIAGRYDLLNRLISLGIDKRWRRRAVASLQLRAGQLLADLATGTADVALEAVRQVDGLRVVGVDPSEKMLEVGRQKVTARGLDTRVELRHGTAEQLPFADGTVDAISMAFGIRNVVDRPAALREMRRVLKPGGRLAILELAEPRRGVMGSLARLHVHHVVPAVGAFLSGSREYRYLQRSIAAFPPPESFAALVRDAGFTEVEAQPLTFGTCCLFVGRVPENAA